MRGHWHKRQLRCPLTSTMAPLMEPIQRNSRTLPPSRMYLGGSGQKAGAL